MYFLDGAEARHSLVLHQCALSDPAKPDTFAVEPALIFIWQNAAGFPSCASNMAGVFT
jgi:hypothetical protein